MAKIIGRKREIEELLRLYQRDEAQLITIHGRRRVGHWLPDTLALAGLR